MHESTQTTRSMGGPDSHHRAGDTVRVRCVSRGRSGQGVFQFPSGWDVLDHSDCPAHRWYRPVPTTVQSPFASLDALGLHYDPDPGDNSTVINVLGADYFFNKDLWIRVFTQNNSQNSKYYFYGLFGWRFKPPFGAAYLIYSSDQYDLYLPDQELMQSKILFLKLTYPLQIF